MTPLLITLALMVLLGFLPVGLQRITRTAARHHGQKDRHMLTESEMNELRSGVHARATAALEKLTAYSDRARALLKRIEWSGAEPDFQEDYAAACPVCRELKSPHAEHEPDCELAALIGAKP